MSRWALLDINVLVALFDPDHVHHDLAHDCFANASLRGVRGTGRRFLSSKEYEFWPDDVSIADDILLGLATRRGGHLVTFDRSIPVKAVIGAERPALTVVEPAVP